jgi:opacity protein-like surface antigen
MKRLLAAVFAVAISGGARAADPGQGYGLGMESCAQFAKAYADNPTVTEDLYFTWAQGFMSGLNLEALANNMSYRVLNGTEMAAQKVQIRSYCDRHPLAQYAMAITNIYNGFPSARPNSN